MPTRSAALVLLALAGCLRVAGGPEEEWIVLGSDPSGPPGSDPAAPDPFPLIPVDACGDQRLAARVYYGTSAPSFVPLVPGQVWAVGELAVAGGICSGTLIAPRWVLTAKHCTEHGTAMFTEFRMGAPNELLHLRIRASRIVEHETADLALVELATDVTAAEPSIVPIRLLTENLGEAWVGRTAEAAGFGETEDGELGSRRFTAEPISGLSATLLELNGAGTRGLCFGDSGGPALVVASDGTVRVAGALSAGESSCTGRDRFTRVDTYRDWILGYAGTVPSDDGLGCGAVPAEGRCLDDLAVRCDGSGGLRAERCDGGTLCGWDTSLERQACIAESADPCGGIDVAGICDGDVARWCDRGTLRSRNCGACGETCQVLPDVGGAYCGEDPCRGVDSRGRCDGTVVTWCQRGHLVTKDCATTGEACGWIDDTTGFYCK